MQSWRRRWRISPAALIAAWPVAIAAGASAPAATIGVPQVSPPAATTGVPQVSPLQHILPPAKPALGAGLPEFQPQTAEGALPSVTIPVRSVSIVGATAFPAPVLDAIVRGLAGHRVPLAKIEAARRVLVALYRRHGFILSTISLDIDAQGNVRFIVTEGYIAAVKLSQDIGPTGSMVLAFLDHLTAERPVSEGSLERWLLLAQQVPGVSVHAVLQADNDDPGALTLVAEVSKQSVSALVTADNRSFVDTGPAEGLTVLDLNSATSLGDQTEISFFHTSGNTDNFGQASESFFIGSDGLRLQLYGGSGRAWPGGALGSVAYESDIEVFGGQLSYPLLLRRNYALNLALHLDAVEDQINTEHLRVSYDSLRVGRVSAQYAWEDLWAGNTRDAESIFDMRESEGIPYFGASPDGRTDGQEGRLQEKIDFWKVNGSFERTQTLFSPYAGATVALELEAGGQFTTDILPSEEEFDLGGSSYTRGYYSGQAVGDKAAYATAELQYNTGYNFTLFSLPVDLGAQFYTFYDWGETWTNLASDLRSKVESAGGGVRLGITRYLEVDGEAVERLVTQLDPASPSTAPLSNTVIYWGVTARY
jgi:hemolysin activation/secretion protein